jgi:hypothetical protein
VNLRNEKERATLCMLWKKRRKACKNDCAYKRKKEKNGKISRGYESFLSLVFLIKEEIFLATR